MRQIVDRPLADAVRAGDPAGPRWLLEPEAAGAFGCVQLDRAFLVLPQFFPVTVTGETYFDAFQIFGDGKYTHLYGPETAAALDRRLPALMAATPSAGSFVLGGSANHFHWLIDFLPRLSVLSAAPHLAARPCLVNGSIGPAQRSVLAFATGALGLPDLQLRPVEGTIVGVTNAAIPTRSTHDLAIAFWRRVMAASGVAAGMRGRRLFIPRAGADRRRLVDEAAVAAMLEAAGFETIDPSALPFAEQVRTFAQASVIVGVHGAGLTNMLFASADARIVELRRDPHTTAYSLLARKLGQRIAAINLEEVEDSHPEPLHRDVRLGPEGMATLERFARAAASRPAGT